MRHSGELLAFLSAIALAIVLGAWMLRGSGEKESGTLSESAKPGPETVGAIQHPKLRLEHASRKTSLSAEAVEQKELGAVGALSEQPEQPRPKVQELTVESWWGRLVLIGAREEIATRLVTAWKTPAGNVQRHEWPLEIDRVFEIRRPRGTAFYLLVTRDSRVPTWTVGVGDVRAPVFVPRLLHFDKDSPNSALPTMIELESCAELAVRVDVGEVELVPPPTIHAEIELPAELRSTALGLEREVRTQLHDLERRPLMRVGATTWTIGGLAPGCECRLRLGSWSWDRRRPPSRQLGNPVALLPGERREIVLRLDACPLAGRWTDQNGSPIAGHLVRTVDAAVPVDALTDAEGHFELAYVEAGEQSVVLLQADPDGDVATRSVRLLVPPLEDREPLELTSDRGIYIRGRMLTSNGLAARWGRVAATPIGGTAGITMTCSEDGSFRIGPLRAGEYKVEGINMDPATVRNGIYPMTGVVNVMAGGDDVELRCK